MQLEQWLSAAGRGAITIAVSALLAASGCARLGSGEPPRHLLVVSIDTLRADHLGCYGDARARTETIDRLASEGVLFEAAVAPTPITLPSHATMLTGINPWRLGIRHNGIYSLAEEFETLAERLAEHGFDTAAVIGGYPLTASSGLDQGFAHYDDAVPLESEEGFHFAERRAEEVTDQAIAWLSERGETDRPTFLFVHYYDPHVPYDPPRGYMRPTKRPRDEAFEAYRSEIAYVDDQLERLLDAFDEQDLLDRTLVVVTADHGEGFMQHGELTHGIFLYEELTRVPLILSHAGSLPGGRRVPDVVGLVDLVPTVLSALGLPAGEDLDGTDQWPRARGGPGEGRRTVFAESQLPRLEYGWAPLRAARTAGWKYIDAPEPELYDLRKDPGETKNRVAAETERAGAMLRDIEQAFESEAADRMSPISDEELARLRSLGYLQGSANPGALAAGQDDLPDPKRKIREYNQLQIATFALAEGEVQAAWEVLDELARRDTRNVMVRCRLADAYVAKQDLAGARRVLEQALAIADEDSSAEVLWRLAGLARRRGDHEEALALYRRHAQVAPLSDRTVSRIAEMLGRLERADEAERFLRDWLTEHPHSITGWRALARLVGAAGRAEEARAAWSNVLELRPADAEAAAALRAARRGAEGQRPAAASPGAAGS